MDCDKALELISLELDGMLTEEEERALKAHLEGCGPCRSLLLELTALRDAMPGEEDAPEGFLDGVMERVRAEKVVPLTRGRKNKWKSWAAMAAVFAVVVAGAGGMRSAMEGNGAAGGIEPAAMSLNTAAPPVETAAADDRSQVENAAEQKHKAETAAPRVAEEKSAPQLGAPAADPTPAPDTVSAPADPPAEAEIVPPQLPRYAPGTEAVDGGGETAPPVGPQVAMFSMDTPEETAAADDQDLAGAAPALTEAETAAMERVLEYLGYEDDYAWDTPYTVLWPRQQDADTQAALSYTGVSENRGYYTFEVNSRVFGFQPDEPEQFHSALVMKLAVPVDGGDIVEGAGPWYDALLSE